MCAAIKTAPVRGKKSNVNSSRYESLELGFAFLSPSIRRSTTHAKPPSSTLQTADQLDTHDVLLCIQVFVLGMSYTLYTLALQQHAVFLASYQHVQWATYIIGGLPTFISLCSHLNIEPPTQVCKRWGEAHKYNNRDSLDNDACSAVCLNPTRDC